jgi:prepilin-type N-terminal cleavage/methylation domain-containing protein
MQGSNYKKLATSRGFTLIEVLLSVTLLSFVAVVVLEGSGASKSISNKIDNKSNFYNKLSLIMLQELKNTKDSISLDEHLSSIKLDDKVRGYLKTQKLKYQKNIIKKEELIILNSLKISDNKNSAFLYSFELGK